MKKILLVCSAGMSTSLLVNKMKDAAKECGEEVEINALAIAECIIRTTSTFPKTTSRKTYKWKYTC